jgi:hypothetical protein
MPLLFYILNKLNDNEINDNEIEHWSKYYRDGSYTYARGLISLENVTLEDSGYYYCTARGPEDEARSASLQLQVII